MIDRIKKSWYCSVSCWTYEGRMVKYFGALYHVLTGCCDQVELIFGYSRCHKKQTSMLSFCNWIKMMKAPSDVQQWIRSAMNSYVCQNIWCVEKQKQDKTSFSGGEAFFFFSFCEGVLWVAGYCFAADLNLGKFTWVSLEMVVFQESQLRLRINWSSFYLFS